MPFASRLMLVLLLLGPNESRNLMRICRFLFKYFVRRENSAFDLIGNPGKVVGPWRWKLNNEQQDNRRTA